MTESPDHCGEILSGISACLDAISMSPPRRNRTALPELRAVCGARAVTAAGETDGRVAASRRGRCFRDAHFSNTQVERR